MGTLTQFIEHVDKVEPCEMTLFVGQTFPGRRLLLGGRGECMELGQLVI